MADERRKIRRDAQQLAKTHAGIPPHAVEHMHQIFGANISIRSGCEWTSPKAAKGRIEMTYASTRTATS